MNAKPMRCEVCNRVGCDGTAGQHDPEFMAECTCPHAKALHRKRQDGRMEGCVVGWSGSGALEADLLADPNLHTLHHISGCRCIAAGTYDR